MSARYMSVTGLLFVTLLAQSGDALRTGMPFLAPEEGGTLRTWLERGPEETVTLRLQRWSDGRPAGPVRAAASGTELLANWADFPSSLVDHTGRWWVQWLVRKPGPGFAYEIRLSVSRDAGETWSEPVTPHTDTSPVEHGFVSMVPWRKGIALVWLDGRDMAGHGHGHGEGSGATRLYYTTIDPRGRRGEEVLLDDRVCDCCQTDMVRTRGRTLVAYRDRSPEEIRDIRVLRREDGRWHPSVLVASDGWEFEGCPVNGPALAAAGRRAAVAWFTAARGEARTYLAFSDDGGRSFGERVRIDAGRTLGRTDVGLLSDGTALVSWMEIVDKQAEVRLRAWGPEGPRGEALTIGVTGVGRPSGFPRLAVTGDHVDVGWTDTREGREVRWRRVRISELLEQR